MTTSNNIIRNNEVVTWKGFTFPLSIKSFSMKEDTKVATYEYANRNGAEHERVLAYRTVSLSGTFTTDSGEKLPSVYVNTLRGLNDNKPGLLTHPVFWSIHCIVKSMEFNETGEELEASVSSTTGGTNHKAVPNFDFSIEFWEHTPPTAASVQSNLQKLFPAMDSKPANDNYETKLKYKTVGMLYKALVEWKISAGLDPIRNAEWLYYDYTFRKTAYDMYLADPTWKQLVTTSNTTISTATAQNSYTIVSWDTAMKIANKFKVNLQDLFTKNSGVKVRKTPKWNDGLYWKQISVIYPGDVILLP